MRVSSSPTARSGDPDGLVHDHLRRTADLDGTFVMMTCRIISYHMISHTRYTAAQQCKCTYCCRIASDSSTAVLPAVHHGMSVCTSSPVSRNSDQASGFSSGRQPDANSTLPSLVYHYLLLLLCTYHTTAAVRVGIILCAIIPQVLVWVLRELHNVIPTCTGWRLRLQCMLRVLYLCCVDIFIISYRYMLELLSGNMNISIS